MSDFVAMDIDGRLEDFLTEQVKCREIDLKGWKPQVSRSMNYKRTSGKDDSESPSFYYLLTDDNIGYMDTYMHLFHLM